MIKTVGLGIRAAGKTREECQLYHIENHAPFGRRVAGPLGMIKYVGYYPSAAFTLGGEELPETPWDFIVPERFTEEFLTNIDAWRANDPDGVEITIDEARFCNRSLGVMMTCDENIIVPMDTGRAGVDLIFGAKRKAGQTREQCHAYHRQTHAPTAAKAFGSALLDYTAYYVTAASNLEQGLMDEPPYDILVQTRIEEARWNDMAAWLKTPEAVRLIEDEKQFIDRDSGVAMLCSYHAYLP